MIRTCRSETCFLREMCLCLCESSREPPAGAIANPYITTLDPSKVDICPVRHTFALWFLMVRKGFNQGLNIVRSATAAGPLDTESRHRDFSEIEIGRAHV